MSYEGYTEQLCANGHYSAQDAYAEQPEACPHCGAALAFQHGVDQTNGYSRRHSYSYEAKKAEIGFDDIWHTDHHGNRYATKLIRYEPRGKAWRKLARDRGSKPNGEDANAASSRSDESPGAEGNRPDTVVVSALPEDDGKLIERLRNAPPLNPYTLYDLAQEAATRIETLSREIERLTAERDADLNALRAAVERRVRAETLEEAAKVADAYAATKPDLERSDNPPVSKVVANVMSETGRAIAEVIRAKITTGSGAGEDSVGNE